MPIAAAAAAADCVGLNPEPEVDSEFKPEVDSNGNGIVVLDAGGVVSQFGGR